MFSKEKSKISFQPFCSLDKLICCRFFGSIKKRFAKVSEKEKLSPNQNFEEVFLKIKPL